MAKLHSTFPRAGCSIMARGAPGQLCLALEFSCQAPLAPGWVLWLRAQHGHCPSSQVCSPFPAAPPGSHPKPKTAPRALIYGHYIHKCGSFLTHLYYSTITISISNFCCCSHHKSCSCFYLPMRPRWSCVHCRPVPTFNRELLKGIYKISHHGGRHCCPGPVLPMWELWCAWREPRTASAKGEPRRQHQSLRSAHPSFLQMAPDWIKLFSQRVAKHWDSAQGNGGVTIPGSILKYV